MPKIDPETIEFQVEIDGNRYSPDTTLPYSIHVEITRGGKVEINRKQINRKPLTSIDLSPLRRYVDRLTELVITRNNLTHIDLAPLKQCRALKELVLGGNGLTTVDLGTVTTCRNIQTILVDSNKLEVIDLTPLASLEYLRILSLMSNQLKEIDLTPLASCRNLEVLNIASNKLNSIDLEPLRECEKLTTLWISWNLFKNINLRPLGKKSLLKELYIDHKSGAGLEKLDLTPLLECNSLQVLWLPDTVEYFIDPVIGPNDLFNLPAPIRNLTGQYSDGFFKKVKVLEHSALFEEMVRHDGWAEASLLFDMQPVNKHYEILGFQGLEGCKEEISKVAKQVPNTYDFEKGRKFILNHLLEALSSRLEKNESTIGIDIEFLKKNEGIKHIPRILELREREMHELIQRKSVSRANLSDLRRTYYGNAILNALGIHRVSVNDDKYQEIVAAIHELGYEL